MFEETKKSINKEQVPDIDYAQLGLIVGVLSFMIIIDLYLLLTFIRGV